MPLFLVGFQKYFIMGLIGLVLILGATAWGYRATARYESLQRAAIEQQLETANAAITTLRRSQATQAESLRRAEEDQTRLQEDRRLSRERILLDPNEDTPASTILRDAIGGVR